MTRPGATRSDLPAGIVTFVFSDIEASTRLLARLKEEAAPLFDRHREILRRAWRAHDGHEVSAEGDGSLAAFADVNDALAACAAGQRALYDEPWPAGARIRCRMGVHSGVAAPRHDDYVALAVHQAARIVATAHGGQIVVSEAATAGVDTDRIERLTPIGQYRVRDFDGPQMLYRLDPDGLPVVDTPVRATPAGNHNLVVPPTSFVDRVDDLDALALAVAPGRIVTLIGPGGVGKTRLAVEVGLRVAPSWRDGVWAIDLADLTDASQIAEQTAETIDAPSAGADRWDDVLAWAQVRNALLMFDNVERHVASCARLLSTLMRCADIGVMATGREPLNVAGEHIHRVLPLATSNTGGGNAAVAAETAGVQLFVDRARAVVPGFRVDDANRAVIEILVERLDGLPLALEIAASRISVLTPDEIVAGLDDRFQLLRSRDRTLPARQRTVDALLGWSYRLLTEQEQLAFRRMAVFGGSFTKEAAAATVGDADLDASVVPELIWSLVDKSLVVSDLTDHGTRYRLPETVRAYADSQLDETTEGPPAAARLAVWLLDRIGPWRAADRAWISSVADELANLRSLVERLTATDQELAQQIACTIGRYHDAIQSFASGIEELARAVDSLPAPTPARVAMLAALADLHLRGAQIERAETLLAEAVELQDAVGPPPWNDAATDRTRGELASRTGDFERAIDVADAALERNLSPLAQARMHNLAGIARYATGDLTGAAESFARELELYERLEHDASLASAHGNLAEVLLQLGDEAGAARHQEACLDGALEVGQPVMAAYSFSVAARLCAHRGDHALAVRLQSAADHQLHLAGHELYEADRAVADRVLDDAATLLDHEVLHAERASGAGLGIIEAARLAKQVFVTTAGADA